MSRRALAVAVSLAVLVLAGSSRPAAAATRGGSDVAVASAQSDLISVINSYRASHGLQLVAANGALMAAAGWMATDMANKNYLSHISTDGRTPAQRMSAFGYPAGSLYTGEDLGAGYTTASAVLSGWQASAAHNAILLSPNYNAIGVGLAYNASSTYKWYWVADFGGPGGIVSVPVPPAPVSQPRPVRAAPPPRAAAPEAADAGPREDEATDPAAAALEARRAFTAAIGERRIVHLMALLLRMGVI